MTPIYSKTPFDGYTHRFVVEVEITKGFQYPLNIYSNSGSFQILCEHIKKNIVKDVFFDVVFRATKEQDDLCSEFIKDMLEKEQRVVNSQALEELENWCMNNLSLHTEDELHEILKCL